VSPSQLDHDGFVADVNEALAASGLLPAALRLEITETALMRDSAAATRRLRELKALGIQIAIDDFGTGYSSLAYLRQLPVDSLKIDRSFISGLTTSSESRALIHTLVELGKALGLQSVAEGIEHVAQLRQLQLEECEFGQGFLLGRPQDPVDIETLLPTESDPAPAQSTPPGPSDRLAAALVGGSCFSNGGDCGSFRTV